MSQQKKKTNTSLNTIREAVSIFIRADYNPLIGAVIVEQQGALELYPSQYPCTLRFYLDITQPALAFDSAIIEDDLDPFDISDHVTLDI